MKGIQIEAHESPKSCVRPMIFYRCSYIQGLTPVGLQGPKQNFPVTHFFFSLSFLDHLTPPSPSLSFTLFLYVFSKLCHVWFVIYYRNSQGFVLFSSHLDHLLTYNYLYVSFHCLITLYVGPHASYHPLFVIIFFATILSFYPEKGIFQNK